MNRTTRNVLWGVGFVAGLTLLGTGAANADTTGEDGTASGTQVLGVVDLPVNLGGNAISLLGDSSSSGSATNGAGGGSSNSASSSTSGADGTASGTQVSPDAKAPVNVSGNAISVLGDSRSAGSTSNAGSSTASNSADETDGTDGVASGTQVSPDLALPIALGGNAISVLGDSSSTGSNSSADGASTSGGSGGETSGTDGIAGGNQVIPGVSLPVAVGGNAISVLGESSSTGSTGSGSGTAGGVDAGGDVTDGAGGVLGGTQLAPNVGVPVTVGGNAISVIGDTTTGEAVTVPIDPTAAANPVDFGDATVTLAAAGDTLAITGVDPWAALLTAGMLLLGALLLLGFGRIRRTARG